MRALGVGRAAVLGCGWMVVALVVQAAPQETKPFESKKGYRITGPDGWSEVSAQLTEEQKARLPEKIRKLYNPASMDVMFMEAEGPETQAFRDNLNVVVVEEALEPSEETVGLLKTAFVEQYKAVFQDFELLGMEVRDLKDGPRVIEVRVNYTLLGNKLLMHQMLVSGKKRSLVVTMTAKRGGGPAASRLLEKAVTSVKWTP